jgi:hypothetical protein
MWATESSSSSPSHSAAPWSIVIFLLSRPLNCIHRQLRFRVSTV